MRQRISDIVSLVGAVSLTVSAFLTSIALGFATVGVFALVISYFLRE